MIILLIVVIILLVIILWGIYENKVLLTVRREDLGGSLKIAHISDTHRRSFGRNSSELIAKTAAESPDLILITGDMVSRDETDFRLLRSTLNGLNKIAPVYMIYGNHEQSLPPEFHPELEEIIHTSGTILLNNKVSKRVINDNELYICGIYPKYTTYKKSGGYRDLDTVTAQDIKAMVGDRPSGRTLLMAHNPLFAESYAEWGAEYTFSGHVHGGSVRLFGVGLLSPERKFLPRYSKGVYDVNGMKLCVSAGLGKPRLFDPAEIVVYRL